MAVLNTLLVTGNSRLLGKLYVNDMSIGSDLEVGGSLTTDGALYVATSTAANAIVYLNNKRAFRGVDAYLRINDQNDFTNGVYFGTSRVRTDNSLEIGNGSTLAFNATMNSTTIYKPTTISSTLSVTGDTTLGTANITTAIANSIQALDINASSINVSDGIRANSYSIETIQNLGGHFLVCPSIEVPSTNASYFYAQVTKVSTTSIRIGFRDDSLSTDTFSDTQWTANSKVKISGTINNVVLGTCNGVIESWNKSSNYGVVTILVTCDEDIAANFSTTATQYTSSQVSNLSIMMYELCPNPAVSQTTYPIGIYLTAYGANKYSYIDVYSGTSSVPTTRMGRLNGLAAVNGVTPTGWGFYSVGSGYFGGTLVSPSGKIGGFNIGSALYSPVDKSSLDNADSYDGVYVGTDGITLGKNKFKVTSSGYLTASSGKIGDFNIGGALYSGTHTAYDTNTNGIFIGTTYVSGGPQAVWWLKSDGSAKIGKLTLSANGDLSVATLSALSGNMGTLTAGTISYGTVGSADSFYLSNSDTSATIAGLSRSYLRLAVGSNFGVDKTGNLFASNANINGTITATSGYIGGTTGFMIDGTAIRTYNKVSSSTDSYSITLSSTGFSRTINGTPRSSLVFAIGSTFGVGADGTLYADAGYLTNVTVGTISASNISGGILALGNMTVTGTMSADRISGGSISANNVTITGTLSSAYLDVSRLTGGYIDASHINASSITLSQLGNSNSQNVLVDSTGIQFRSGSTSRGYINVGSGVMGIYATVNRLILTNSTNSTIDFNDSSGYASIYAASPMSVNSSDISISSGTNDLKLYSNGHNVRLTSSGNFRPNTDGSQNCGMSTSRWKEVYSTKAACNTSDRKEKDNIKSINFANELIMSLEPISYMWKTGDHRRKYMGFIAQDIAKICKSIGENLAFIKAEYKVTDTEKDMPDKHYYGEDVDDSLLIWSIAPTELIAPMVAVIQQQQKEIDELKTQVKELMRK